MGLLDDAIRDHLELKRRHGADPGEVARQEHEALGPARREPIASPAPAEEPAPSVYDDEYADGDEVPADERLDAPSRHAPAEPAAGEAEAPVADDPEPEPRAEPEQPTEQFSVEELEAASQAPPSRPEDDVVPADEEPEEAHDELEETPEFLQETPEHDRLWFEQKPPRDFDF
jgi:hypothetical protein